MVYDEAMRKYRHESFWREFGTYCLNEFMAVVMIFVYCIIATYFIVSLFVGMYHVSIYLLKLLL